MSPACVSARSRTSGRDPAFNSAAGPSNECVESDRTGHVSAVGEPVNRSRRAFQHPRHVMDGEQSGIRRPIARGLVPSCFGGIAALHAFTHPASPSCSNRSRRLRTVRSMVCQPQPRCLASSALESPAAKPRHMHRSRSDKSATKPATSRGHADCGRWSVVSRRASDTACRPPSAQYDRNRLLP